MNLRREFESVLTSIGVTDSKDINKEWDFIVDSYSCGNRIYTTLGNLTKHISSLKEYYSTHKNYNEIFLSLVYVGVVFNPTLGTAFSINKSLSILNYRLGEYLNGGSFDMIKSILTGDGLFNEEENIFNDVRYELNDSSFEEFKTMCDKITEEGKENLQIIKKLVDLKINIVREQKN